MQCSSVLSVHLCLSITIRTEAIPYCIIPVCWKERLSDIVIFVVTCQCDGFQGFSESWTCSKIMDCMKKRSSYLQLYFMIEKCSEERVRIAHSDCSDSSFHFQTCAENMMAGKRLIVILLLATRKLSVLSYMGPYIERLKSFYSPHQATGLLYWAPICKSTIMGGDFRQVDSEPTPLSLGWDSKFSLLFWSHSAILCHLLPGLRPVLSHIPGLRLVTGNKECP